MEEREEKELLKNFAELKCKQLMCLLHLRVHGKPAYLGSEAGLMINNINVEDRLNHLEEDIMVLVNENKDYFMSTDNEKLDKRMGELGVKVTCDRQKELSKEVLGYSTDLDGLASKLG